MKPGPKPHPKNLRIVRDGDVPEVPAEPDEKREPLVIDAPPAPDYLDDAEAKEFSRVAKILCRMRIMSAADTDALATYATVRARWHRLRAELAEEDDVIKSPTGHLKPNPKLQLIEKAETQMRLLLAEFGLTPSSRTRVGA